MVATYTAADPENGDIAWSLSGDDADDFEISGAGTLTFVSSPDYENPMDENAGNMYSVMVVASDGTNDGAMGVTVTDVDENVAPEFAEDTTTREVEENTPQGGNIGGPVAAMAGDDDMLTPRQSCPPFPVRGFPAQLPDRHEPRQAPWWHRGCTCCRIIPCPREVPDERKRSASPLLWGSVGGALMTEFQAVDRRAPAEYGYRSLDAVIVLGELTRVLSRPDYIQDLRDRDIIVVQAKTGRVGMYLLGQALFSRELMRRFHPRTALAVAVCEKDDSVLRPIAEKYGVEIVCLQLEE